jgi:hypothetical protein
MRALGVTLFLLLSSLGFADMPASPACAKGDRTLHVCSAKLQPLDHQIAIDQFSSLAFCSNQVKGTYAVALDREEHPQVFGMRASGVPKTFPMKYLFWGTGLDFIMTVKGVKKAVNATLSVVFTKDYAVSSSFDCR